jgi:hypothetical protein
MTLGVMYLNHEEHYQVPTNYMYDTTNILESSN